MSDTTITPEKRKMFREDASFVVAKEKKNLERVGAAEAILLLLNALEHAEARLAESLQVNATRQAEVTADMLNAMMAGITGQKESVRVEVGGFQCPCNEISKTIEAATAHDAACPKHPAVMRAEKAEAERRKDLAHCKFEFERAEDAEAKNARLTKMVTILSEWCAQFESGHTLEEVGLALSNGMACPEPWQYVDEAARRAVADGESEVKG